LRNVGVLIRRALRRTIVANTRQFRRMRSAAPRSASQSRFYGDTVAIGLLQKTDSSENA
jgi:hypothetical protein